jgi:hypothetical protein
LTLSHAENTAQDKPAAQNWRRGMERAGPLLLIVLLIVLWQVLARAFDVPKFLLPAPTDIARLMVDEWPLIQMHSLATIGSIVSGYVTAVLLMDKPFAALDEITRDRMAFELMWLWHHYRKTVLFVTPSLAEAVFLSDRVVLMSARPGRVHQVFEIDLPRPRDRDTRLTDRFHRTVSELNRELYRVMA